MKRDGRLRSVLIWVVLVITLAVPIAAATTSPLLAWRDPIYIAAGIAGVIAMSLMLMQPLLAAGYLPGVSMARGRRVHRWIGSFLVTAIAVHVAGLWITSPPDVLDALFFVSPTQFSAWGVIAMWAVFTTALLAALRRRMRMRLRLWRLGHTGLVTVAVIGSSIHALLIEGTMETVSKAVLCALVLIATVKALADLKIWEVWKRRDT